jgi:hypothetical protein
MIGKFVEMISNNLHGLIQLTLVTVVVVITVLNLVQHHHQISYPMMIQNQ